MTSVLIVEDDLSLLKLYDIFLTLSGFTVFGKAKNGDEAVNLFKQIDDRPDIIIMDHRMPIKNGIEASKEILQIDENAKIILASADKTIENSALSIGITTFMSKPFTYKLLLDNISKALTPCIEN